MSGAMLGSGFLIYVFHVLAARALGPGAYGQVAVLWAAMFLVVIVLFRPLEQTISRALADRLARGHETKTVVRSVAALAAGVLVAVAIGFALGWSAIADRLFLGDGVMTALLAAGIAGYGIAYVARGIVAGVHWYAGYGLGLIVDSLARLAIAIPLLFVASKATAGAAVALAGIVGGLVPLWIGRARIRAASHAAEGPRFHAGAALAFAAPASLIAAADQLLVNGGALLVMVEGGPNASETAGIVFAATMLIRVPVYVFQGLAASLLPNFTRIQALDDERLFRRAVLRATLVLLAAGAVIVAGAALAGPATMERLYGAGFEAGRPELILLGLSVGGYLAASTLSQGLLALDRGGRAAACWVTAALLFVSLYAFLPGEPLMRISVSLAVACFADLLLLGAVVLAGRRR
jgi:O-antigen/teichoic acid export membrane protein